MMPDENPQRPGQLISSPHVHVATRDQAKPMLKLLGRMVKMRPGKPAVKAPSARKGLQAPQTVTIKHKKIFY
jgi:hypothetical protein